jgi:inner membrane protein
MTDRRTTARPFTLAADEGRTETPLNVVGEPTLVKVSAADSNGALAMFHLTAPPLTGPPLHVHTREDETFYVLDGERIHATHVNLIRRRARPEPAPDASFIERLDAPYRPLDDAAWEVHSRFGENDADRTLARSAWQADELAFFRRFAELPVYDGTTPGSTCVWFFDLRFEAPGRDTVPFRYGACRDAPEARWRVHEVDKRGRIVRLAR